MKINEANITTYITESMLRSNNHADYYQTEFSYIIEKPSIDDNHVIDIKMRIILVIFSIVSVSLVGAHVSLCSCNNVDNDNEMKSNVIREGNHL